METIFKIFNLRVLRVTHNSCIDMAPFNLMMSVPKNGNIRTMRQEGNPNNHSSVSMEEAYPFINKMAKCDSK